MKIAYVNILLLRLLLFVVLLHSCESYSILNAQNRKKVAIVLSGGGAKGAAHIGALKVLEEAEIPIDIVVGTSMGSIVGGLYAIGYTAEQLDSMVRQQDWAFLLTDKVLQSKQSLIRREFSDNYSFSIPLMKNRPKVSGLIRGENINTLFAELTVGYHGNLDFDNLPRKYACVATNMETGEEYVFRRGKLAIAMRASMAIPGVFTPVYMDSLVLADGGLCNNYPADVARMLGADIIIGVSVHEELRKSENLTTMNEILSQVVDIACRNKLEDNIALTDLFVHVNSAPYGTASFNSVAIDSLIVKGERTTREFWDKLLELKKRIGERGDNKVVSSYQTLHGKQNIYIENIELIGIDENKARRLMQRCKLLEGEYNSLNQIKDAIYILRDEYQYSDVTYLLKPKDLGYDLELKVNSKKDINLNLGVRYDTEENASLLLGGTFSFATSVPSSLTLAARLGNRLMGQINYTFTPTLLKHLSFQYTFIDNDVNIHYKGKRFCNLAFKQHQLELKYSNVWWRNFQYDLGVKFDGFTKPEILRIDETAYFNESNSCKFLNYFLRVKYNSMENIYFPMNGVNFNADYTVYTDNFYQRRGHTPFSAISTRFKSVIPISRKLVVQPFLGCRFLIGKDIPTYYLNYQGGVVSGIYFDQQFPVDGIYNLEYVDNAFCQVGTKIQQRITGQHYVILSGTLFSASHTIENILKKKPYYGVSLGYGLQSRIGPFQILTGYSNYSECFKLYVNVGHYF